MVGPALVLVEAGRGAIGDRVADHHHAARAGVGLDLDTGQSRRAVVLLAARSAWARLWSPAAIQLVWRPSQWNVWTAAGPGTKTLTCSACRSSVASASGSLSRSAGADHHAGLAVEAERVRRAAHACGDAGRSDPQRLGTVGIAQPHPQPRPARLMRAVWRKVLSCSAAGTRVGKRKSAPQTGCGLACQLATQCGAVAAGSAGQGNQCGGGELAQAVHRAIPEGGIAMVILRPSVN